MNILKRYPVTLALAFVLTAGCAYILIGGHKAAQASSCYCQAGTPCPGTTHWPPFLESCTPYAGTCLCAGVSDTATYTIISGGPKQCVGGMLCCESSCTDCKTTPCKTQIWTPKPCDEPDEQTGDCSGCNFDVSVQGG